MTAEDILLRELENLRHENEQLKRRLENRAVWIVSVNGFVYGEDVFDEYWKGDTIKKDYEQGIKIKAQIEIPELTCGEDEFLDRYNLALKIKAEADNFRGCRLHKMIVK